MSVHFKEWWREELEKEGWHAGGVPLYMIADLIIKAQKRVREARGEIKDEDFNPKIHDICSCGCGVIILK